MKEPPHCCRRSLKPLFFTLALQLYLVGGSSSATPDSSAAPASVLGPKLQHYVDDQVMDLEALGWSDLGAKKAMRVDDVFWIASMTKSGRLPPATPMTTPAWPSGIKRSRISTSRCNLMVNVPHPVAY